MITQPPSPRPDKARGTEAISDSQRISPTPSDALPIEMLARVVEQVAEAVLITDRNGVVQYVNPAFESITGYSRAEILGKKPNVLRSGQHDSALYKNMWDVILSGRPYHSIIANRRKNGEVYHEEKIITPIVNERSEITHFVSTGRDITERLRAEEERARLQGELLRRERLAAIGETMANISHCIKNILSSLKGGVYLLEQAVERNSMEQSEQALQMLRRASGRIYLLVMEMLDYSKVREPAHDPVALEPVFLEASQLLAATDSSEAIRIELDIQPGAENIRLDGERLARTLMNLGTNSMDAMPNGGVLTFRAYRFKAASQPAIAEQFQRLCAESPSSLLAIEVSDTGAGMPEDIRDRIFEPFFSTKGSRGTGLGLAAVRAFAEEHGGRVFVESQMGAGTTFRMIFPDYCANS